MQNGRIIFFTIGCLILGAAVDGVALAQQAEQEPQVLSPASTGVAQYVPLLSDELAADGSLVELVDGEYRLAEQPYSVNLFGVIQQKPAVAISAVGRLGAVPVLRIGTTQALVDARNGRIEVGDFITSSEEPGVGMKATQAGFVIGVALESVPEGEEGKVTVPVAVQAQYIVADEEEAPLGPRSLARQISSVLTVGVRAAAAEPNTFLRYVTAALMMLIAMGFGFLVFGRSAINGIISIGRNPLARTPVLFMVLINTGLALGMVAGGLALGFFILAV